MPNLDDLKYKIDSIIDGKSTNDDGLSLFSVVVDPNPVNSEMIAPEDLFTFVRLRAHPQSRSVILSDGTFDSGKQDNSLYFIGTSTQNGKGYLTTNYTNVGSLEGDNESLGIESIDVSIKMSAPPTVRIKFRDVRGSAVFNNHESFDDQNILYNNSKYNCFFRQPYPIFELTIKGFYGKAVTYYLNLLKFRASADTASGDFVIDCDFLGYDFAFFSDIIMKYVMALNDSNTGKALLKNYKKKNGETGLSSLTDFLTKYTEIAKLTEDFKLNDDEFQTLKEYNTLATVYLNLISAIGLPYAQSQSQSILLASTNGLQSYSAADVFVLPYKDGLTKTIEDEINYYYDTAKKIIDEENVDSQYLIPSFGAISTNAYPIDALLIEKIKKAVTVTDPAYDTAFITTETITGRLGDPVPDNVLLIDSLAIYRSAVFNIYEKILKAKNDQSEKVINLLNTKFNQEIGFNPAIFNIFEIILGNVDVFLEILHTTCVAADRLGENRVEHLRNYIQRNNFPNRGFSDIPFEDNRVYPFPGVYDLDGKWVWLGSVVGENNPNFPELKLVNDLINGLLETAAPATPSFSNQDNSGANTQSGSLNTGRNFVTRFSDAADSKLNFSTIENLNYEDGFSDEFIDFFINRFKQTKDSQRIPDNYGIYLGEVDGLYLQSALHPQIVDKFRTFSKTRLLADFSTRLDLLYDEPLNTEDGFYLLEPDDANSDALDDAPLTALPSTYGSLGTFLKKAYKNNDIEQFGETEIPFFDITNFYISEIKEQLTSDENFLYGYTLDLLKIDGKDNNSDKYLSNQHLRIGKYSRFKPGSDKLLADMPVYSDNNAETKTFMMLETMGFEYFAEFFVAMQRYAGAYGISSLYMAYVGAHFYRERFFNENGFDFVTNDIKNEASFLEIATNPFFRYTPMSNVYSQEIKDFLIDKFLELVADFSFLVQAELYTIYGANKNSFSDATKKNYIDAWHRVEEYIKQDEIFILNYPVSLFSGAFVEAKYGTAPKNLYTDYISKIFDIVIQQSASASPNASSGVLAPNPVATNNSNNKSGDTDLKIHIYSHLKNLYDKWLSFSSENGKIYNYSKYIKGQKVSRKLIDHFYFVDRTWSDIGDKAVLNPQPLLSAVTTADTNLNTYLSLIIKDNNFNFFSTPNFVNYYDPQEVANMFKPYTNIEHSEGGATWILMYKAGSSKILDINRKTGYFNDGFDIKSNNFLNIPKTLLTREVPNWYKQDTSLSVLDRKDYISKYNMGMFRVAYADHNQNIFTAITVNQESIRETAESITVKAELASGRGGAKRVYKGMDIYPLYSVYSYTTQVECMGNMQIMPTQYFQLDNIPMFHGAHIITDVEHRITPHNIVTSFKGSRVSKYVFPVVDKLTSFFNIGLDEQLSISQINGELDNVPESDDTNGRDENKKLLVTDNPLLNNDIIKGIEQTWGQNNFDFAAANVLFELIENNDRAVFEVLPTITPQIAQERASTLFTGNPSSIPSFHAGKSQCAAWTRSALEHLGVFKKGKASTNAWDWFMGLPSNGIKYFESTEPLENWTNELLTQKLGYDAHLLFGYTKGGNYTKIAADDMKTISTATDKLVILTDKKRIDDRSFVFTPITHVGIFVGGLFYSWTGKSAKMQPYSTFVPVGAYEIGARYNEIVKNNAK